jgi:hypothetical protein
MADLGAIGITTSSGYIKGAVVAGTVRDGDNALASRAVYLLNRPADVSVAVATLTRTQSHPTTGAYSFSVPSSQLPSYVATYTVMVFDEGATPFNALVLDRITPA